MICFSVALAALLGVGIAVNNQDDALLVISLLIAAISSLGALFACL